MLRQVQAQLVDAAPLFQIGFEVGLDQLNVARVGEIATLAAGQATERRALYALLQQWLELQRKLHRLKGNRRVHAQALRLV